MAIERPSRFPVPKSRTVSGESAPAKEKPQSSSDKPQARKPRLAYQKRRELESPPATIKTLDAKASKLHALLAQPEFYKQPSSEIARMQSQLKELDRQLAAAYRP